MSGSITCCLQLSRAANYAPAEVGRNARFLCSRRSGLSKLSSREVRRTHTQEKRQDKGYRSRNVGRDKATLESKLSVGERLGEAIGIVKAYAARILLITATRTFARVSGDIASKETLFVPEITC